MNLANRCLACLTIGAVPLAGCESPPPRDIALAADLTPPASDEVRIKASALVHPILQPIVFDDTNGLSADEAAVLAVIASPTLQAARSRRRLAQAQVLQAGILPNPELTYGMDFPVGERTQNIGTGYGVGVSWEVTSLLQRAARRDSAAARAESVDLEIAWQEWQVSQAARLHVLRLSSLRREIGAAGAITDSLVASTEVLRRSVDLGGASALDLAAAERAQAQATAARLAVDQELQGERLALNSVLGLPPDATVRLEEATPAADAAMPTTEEVLEGIADRRLDLVALRHGYESQEAELRAAVRGRFPKARLGFLGGRDAGEPKTLGFGIAIELPVFDRNQGVIAAAEATRDALFEEYRARLFEARHQAARLLADLEATRQRLRVERAALESLRRLVEGLDEPLRQGTLDAGEYFRARHDLAQRELDVARLSRTAYDLRIGLEIAAGRYIPMAAAEGDGP